MAAKDSEHLILASDDKKIDSTPTPDIMSHVNPDSDPSKQFVSLLIVDDEPEICNVLGKLIVETVTNTLIVCTCSPKTALNISKELFFDVVVCDINMKEMLGTDLMAQIKLLSPPTYMIAMTGLNKRMAFLAGKIQPDEFHDKSEGVDALFAKVRIGLERAAVKRKDLAPEQYDMNTDSFYTKELNWRDKKEMKDKIGLSSKSYDIARMKIKALALKGMGKFSETEVADKAGYSTVQKMRNSIHAVLLLLEKNLPVLNRS